MLGVHAVGGVFFSSEAVLGSAFRSNGVNCAASSCELLIRRVVFAYNADNYLLNIFIGLGFDFSHSFEADVRVRHGQDLVGDPDRGVDAIQVAKATKTMIINSVEAQIHNGEADLRSS